MLASLIISHVRAKMISLPSKLNALGVRRSVNDRPVRKKESILKRWAETSVYATGLFRPEDVSNTKCVHKKESELKLKGRIIYLALQFQAGDILSRLTFPVFLKGAICLQDRAELKFECVHKERIKNEK